MTAPIKAGDIPLAVGSGRRYRIAFVNTHPIQYFAPLYAHLTRHGGIDATALYLSDFSLRGGHDRGFGKAVRWDIDLLDGYAAEFMGKAASRRTAGGFFSMVAPELWGAIRRGCFDGIVIHGHNLAAHHVALAAAKSAGVPVFARGETHSGLQRAPWKETLRRPLLKSWYKAFDGFLAIGNRNASYYRDMGVQQSKIFTVPYTVDNDRFIASARQARTDRAGVLTRLGLKQSGGAANAPVILFSAKFDQRKRPRDIIVACHKLQQQGVATELVMVGSGVLEPQLRALAGELGLANVVFPGFVNQAELPSVYAASDIFVLPSENEPWGLAINEAMCAGLPIVLSEEIGCVPDLVENGVNGATHKAGDIDGLAAALRPIVMDKALRERCGQASLERIGRWSYAECGAGLRAACDFAHARRA